MVCIEIMDLYVSEFMTKNEPNQNNGESCFFVNYGNKKTSSFLDDLHKYRNNQE